jgi:hypothetical protein
MNDNEFTLDFAPAETPSLLVTAISDSFEDLDGSSQEELLLPFGYLDFEVDRLQILSSALPYGNMQKINSFSTNLTEEDWDTYFPARNRSPKDDSCKSRILW